MEDTGITYKTCEDSLRSYTMVDWHASNQAVQQSDRDSEYAKYVEYVEYTEYVEDDLVSSGWDRCTPPELKHRHIRASLSR